MFYKLKTVIYTYSTQSVFLCVVKPIYIMILFIYNIYIPKVFFNVTFLNSKS